MLKRVLSESEVKQVMDRFQQINEYGSKPKKKSLNEFAFLTELNEEGEDDPNAGGAPQDGPDPNAAGGGAPMGADAGAGDPMGGDAGADPMGGGGAPMGADPNAGGPDAMDAGSDPMGGSPMDSPMGGGPDAMGADPMGGGNEEVIDVDDLTQSQETTELRIDDMNDKLETLMKVLQKYSQAVDSLDTKIADVKSEIAHRMPTKQEKLELRSVASTPYETTPEEFWSKKLAMNPHYSLEKDAKERESFDITEDDLADYNNFDVLRSFNENKMELKNYLQF